MKRNIPWGAVAVTVSAVVLVSFFSIPIYRARHSHPSSGALSAVLGIFITAQLEASKSADQCFLFAEAPEEQRRRFQHSLRKRPVGSQCFIAPKIFSNLTGPRHIVVFCDAPTPEDEEGWLSSPKLKHAVAYSDGGKALISTAEYAGPDRSHFLPVSDAPQK